MLGLRLREEFQGRRLKGTAIELANANNTGAIQVAAADFLRITYPSGDVLKAIEAAGPGQGRPVVLIGDRGQGKTHLMGVLYHAFTGASATRSWLKEWGDRLGNSKVSELPLREGMHVITESLHRQSYRFLWDLVFERHPHGSYVRGKWEGLGDKRTDVPNYDLLIEIFKHTPTALVLDEFQTWYDGLTNTKQYPWRNWAFNFIQLLSEIAKEHPEILVLVVSVRNGRSDAFQQVQRVNPILVDFKGPTAKRDRQRLLLHRLFENRMQVADSQIIWALNAHVSEYFRLLEIPPAEHDRIRKEFIEAWPYAPHLMQLLEDQVLVATEAQETRDLIRILADLFKRHGERPVITAADFRLDDDKSGITALLDSVSNQHHANLREKAQRNLSAVTDAVKNPDQVVPHLAELVGSLWLRSLAVGNMAGAAPAMLQVDITREKPIDDNGFQVELAAIVENSFNIHEDGTRLVFREEENPQAKLIANARNDKLFTDGSDKDQLRREVRYVIGGPEDVARTYQVIVLPASWTNDPWSSIDAAEQPEQWDDRLPLLVLPDPPDKVEARLGTWLKQNLKARRNAVRFLLPREGSTGLFHDRDLLVLTRAVILADRWKTQSPEYRRLLTKYEKELREILKKRFDRFALISTWNYPEPEKCTFHIEGHKAQGSQIPDAIDKHVRENLFVPEEFDELVLAAAENNESVGKLLRELQEPRPGGESCIPWLGETFMKERIIRICARGDIAINLRGMEYLQVQTGESEDTAWKRMRGKLGTGKHLDETYVLLPQAVPHANGIPKALPGSQDLFYAAMAAGRAGEACTPYERSGWNTTTVHDTAIPAGGVTGSALFGAEVKLTPFASEATSALNLLGKVESWGISTGTQVQALSLKVGKLTGAQLTKILRSLPDGVTYELSLNKEEK